MRDEATTYDVPAAGTGPSEACLVVLAGRERGVIELHRDAPLAIGRSRSSGLVVDDPAVSRLHATLEWSGGDTLRVVDHGSRHGTFVRGARVEGSATAHAGDELVVGPLRALVMLPRAGASAERATTSTEGAIDRLARRAAACDLPVLLVGETGVGKEVLARRIHAESARASGPFVALNCGSIPESLAEATLFGHERGAFTGAHAKREGVFEAASGGTLFLDEIGELPLSSQARLLRVLEDGKVTRVGATAPIAVDSRIVCATHRDLLAMERAGTFRSDLRYRIDVLRIAIPALRERPHEIEALARAFTREASEDAVSLAPDAIALLTGLPWPGNVRELKNAIARAVALRERDVLDASAFREVATSSAASAGALRGTVDVAERAAIEEALRACGGNQTHAAVRLGISRRALLYKMERHGLKRAQGRG